MITVSIIEDDADYRDALKTLLNVSDNFCLLKAYSTAEEALQKIKYETPDIAMVDVKLPGMGGIELIGHIKEMIPDILCLVCSFYSDDIFVFNALKNGASGYILKDSRPDEIIASLTDLFGGGAPMSKFIAKKVISSFQNVKKVSGLTDLSERENEILRMIATGQSAKEVATHLFLSSHTVNKHLKNIYGKLHVNNRVEAINKLNHNK